MVPRAIFIVLSILCGELSFADEKIDLWSDPPEAALEFIGGQYEIGDCSFDVRLVYLTRTEPKEALALDFTYRSEDEDFELARNFSNYESNRSLVNIKYGFFSKQPYLAELERVDANSAPAHKYRFVFKIEDGRPSSVRLSIYFGTQWNRVKTIDCVSS